MNILGYTLIFASLLSCKSETKEKLEVASSSIEESEAIIETSTQTEVETKVMDTVVIKSEEIIEATKEAMTETPKKMEDDVVKTTNTAIAKTEEVTAISEVEKTTVVSKEKEVMKVEEKKQEIETAPIHNKVDEVIAGPDHASWNTLLKKYVDDDGNVNYKAFKDNVSALDAYLKNLAGNAPKSSWSKNEKLAYYINLYNAATVKLIVDNYPTKSIKDIPNRWKKNWIPVGDDITSLNDIEHEVLRKMNEPRIHFAINCASYSCPKLLNAAFTPQNMERLLSKTAVDFVNDTKRNRFGQGKAQLSRIFKWYKSDFTQNTSLLEYINKYLDNPIDKKAKISYLDYDWSLNEAK